MAQTVADLSNAGMGEAKKALHWLGEKVGGIKVPFTGGAAPVAAPVAPPVTPIAASPVDLSSVSVNPRTGGVGAASAPPVNKLGDGSIAYDKGRKLAEKLKAPMEAPSGNALGKLATGAGGASLAHAQGWTDLSSPKSTFMNDPNVPTVEKAKQFGVDAYNIALPVAATVAGTGAGPVGGMVGMVGGSLLAEGLNTMIAPGGETETFKKYATGEKPPNIATPVAGAAPQKFMSERDVLVQEASKLIDPKTGLPTPEGREQYIRAAQRVADIDKANAAKPADPAAAPVAKPSTTDKAANLQYAEQLQKNYANAIQTGTLGDYAAARQALKNFPHLDTNNAARENTKVREATDAAAKTAAAALKSREDQRKANEQTLTDGVGTYTDDNGNQKPNLEMAATVRQILAQDNIEVGDADPKTLAKAIALAGAAHKIHNRNKNNFILNPWSSEASQGVAASADALRPDDKMVSDLTTGWGNWRPTYKTAAGEIPLKELSLTERQALESLKTPRATDKKKEK